MREPLGGLALQLQDRGSEGQKLLALLLAQRVEALPVALLEQPHQARRLRGGDLLVPIRGERGFRR